MASEAQRRAKKKYQEKCNRIYIEFYPTEDAEWEHLQQQEKKQTYIKNLIRADMKGGSR